MARSKPAPTSGRFPTVAETIARQKAAEMATTKALTEHTQQQQGGQR